MRVGVALPHYGFSFPGRDTPDLEAVIAFARRIEALGFDSVWVSDHFFLDLARYGGPSRRYESLEALTTLSTVAVSTQRVRLGTLVLCYAFRHPPVLAKMASTLDVISDGRLEVGLGAGWYEDEFRAFGFEFRPVGERIAAMRETVEIVGGMLSSERFSYRGRFYRVEDAPNDPPPVQRPRPPIWVGGKGGPRLLRIVAETADGWNTVWRWSVDAYAERARALDRSCEAAGRDPASVRRSLGLYTIVGEDTRDLARRWDLIAAGTPFDISGFDRTGLAREALVGTPEEVVSRIKEFEAVGVDHLICSFGVLPFALPDAEQPELFARYVLPSLR